MPVDSSYTLIVKALLPTLCLSIVLTSNFLFSPKWLIIEPKSPQSLKTIYRVLKFAAKYKAPLNRSALTYWEEDIPSRIDLGKSKYGGPFTTEQVEDVKTVLRLLVISLPFSFIVFSTAWHAISIGASGETFPGVTVTSCPLRVISNFIYIPSLYSILGTLVQEFLLYPFIRSRFPSILKRIEIGLFIFTLVCFLCFVLQLSRYLAHSNETVTECIIHFLYQITSGLLTQMLATAVLEFMCAQSPYNMRGLLLSLVETITLVSWGLGWIVWYTITHKACTQSWCYLLPFSVQTVICLIGFLLFLCCGSLVQKESER